jgi:hypothetical protein
LPHDGCRRCLLSPVCLRRPSSDRSLSNGSARWDRPEKRDCVLAVCSTSNCRKIYRRMRIQ